MKIYLAAPWKHKDDAKAVRELIQSAGHTVNSRWLDFEPPANSAQGAYGDDYPVAVLQTEAENDIEDLVQCEALVVLNLDMSEGKACETGMALMLGIPVISVGKGRNVFLNLSQVHRVETVNDAITTLDRLQAEVLDLQF